MLYRIEEKFGKLQAKNAFNFGELNPCLYSYFRCYKHLVGKTLENSKVFLAKVS